MIVEFVLNILLETLLCVLRFLFQLPIQVTCGAEGLRQGSDERDDDYNILQYVFGL